MVLSGVIERSVLQHNQSIYSKLRKDMFLVEFKRNLRTSKNENPKRLVLDQPGVRLPESGDTDRGELRSGVREEKRSGTFQVFCFCKAS